ncbi:MAG: hypothetical protein ACYS7M_09020 [Planctomycetota bacterium]|jgi:hypothetical protein
MAARASSASWRQLRVGAAGLVLLLAGCGALPAGRSGSSGANTESEPNNTFDQARKAFFSGAGIAVLRGAIDTIGDLDVFNLGPLAAGDRLIVDVESLTDGFDASIAVFDASFGLFMDSDDEDTDASLLDPYINDIIRHDADPYYLVVGASAFASLGTETGDYLANVTIELGNDVPPASRQVLFLDFDGGVVEPDNLLTKQVRPFDAAAISPLYAGQDELIMGLIIQTVVENFEGFDVAVVVDPANLAVGEEFSTVMFGSRNRQVFGVAQAVDHYNTDHGDMAIIFTESFDPSKFIRPPSAEDLGLAIGNIGAHEAGHLLGLNHVDDPTAVMDGASPADTFVQDQDFKVAPLSSDILPIGTQDALTLLAEIVGLL